MSETQEGSATYLFVADLTQRIVPYVRTTQRQKWVDKQFLRYRESQAFIKRTLQDYLFLHECSPDWHHIPKGAPIRAAILVSQTALHRGDLDNVVKAILDAAQGIVYPQDCWIDQIYATRSLSTDEKSQAFVAFDLIDGSAFLPWCSKIVGRVYRAGWVP